MACCKVPIKIAGFSGGCARVTDGGGILQNLTDINDTNFQVSSSQLSYLAFLGLKCVNIACPPNLVVADTLESLALFLNAQLTSTINTDVALTVLTDNVSGVSLIQNGIAQLIAGCSCCAS